jgi:glycosyltransferase involved in cell wall biosynthesis
MKTLFITAQTPWGRGEVFILEELLDVELLGADFVVIPRNPPKEVFHKEGNDLLKKTVRLPLFSVAIGKYFIKILFAREVLWKMAKIIIVNSRNPVIALKNLAVFPKAVFVAKIIQKNNIDHIHAHWGTTTATMAFVISKITGIPWSFTLHRWDITENNLLREKAKSAVFIRCISRHGMNNLSRIIGNEFEPKLKMIHMGVNKPDKNAIAKKINDDGDETLTIAVPANLIDVKGHIYLIKAIALLPKERAQKVICLFFGDGHLEGRLRRDVKRNNLGGQIKFLGAIPHNHLMEFYQKSVIDLVILPSIHTHDGSHEGIPVSLMEAMAYGIPAVSTNTGGISELLGDGAGIIVPEKDPRALAWVISEMLDKKIDINRIRISGKRKVYGEFNSQKNTATLLDLIKSKKKA